MQLEHYLHNRQLSKVQCTLVAEREKRGNAVKVLSNLYLISNDFLNII